MKLYGNKKRRPNSQKPQPQAAESQQKDTELRRQTEEPWQRVEEPWRQTEEPQQRAEKAQAPEPETEEESSGLSGRTKAMLLLAAAICIFLCATVMCLTLISKSAEVLVIPSEQEAKELSYVVNSVQPSSAEVPVDFEAPVSRNYSETVNILLMSWDEKNAQTDTLMIASVQLKTGEFALLSIPRDTYIAGNYEVPKINRVYGEADDGKDRGVKATLEMVKSMVGFEIDYYFVLDEASLTAMTDMVGGVDFTVPDTPDYSEISAGKQTIDGKKAMQLFSYRDGYTDVETEPAAVQRDFLLALLDKLLKDPDAYEQNAQKLAEVSDTDLTAENITYLAYLLQNVDTTAVFSRALPGGEIEIDGVTYYEVDPEAAIELLNAHFNPLKADLTVYDVNFRQETGDSGSGEYDPYGFGGNTSNSSEETEEPTEDSTEDTDAPTEGPDPADPTDSTDATDSTDSTDSSDSTDATDATEAPTDAPPETDPPTEPPVTPEEP